jgi:hypothetical protein
MSAMDEVMGDLSELIQDAGFQPDRFQKFGTSIMKALDTDDPHEAMSVVEGFVLAMGDDKYATSARYALGIFNNDEIGVLDYRLWRTPTPDDEWLDPHLILRDRRKVLIKSAGFTVSEATLRRWEKVGLKTLAGRIIEAGKRKSNEPSNDLVAEVKHLRKEVQELKGMIEQLLKLSK